MATLTETKGLGELVGGLPKLVYLMVAHRRQRWPCLTSQRKVLCNNSVTSWLVVHHENGHTGHGNS